MDSKKKSSLYLHIPFCRRKCLYCDFFSAGEKLADWSLLVKALLNEAESRKDEIQIPDTIYIGGGTPSLIPIPYLSRLIEGLGQIFTGWAPEEFTIEVNPDDVDEEKAAAWRSLGIGRVSLGIQSFSDDELRAVGRRHDARQGEAALEILGKYFDNVSADLIFGLPKQTFGSWRESVERLIALRPQHISAYSLMYEPGTVLTALREDGRLSPTPEDESERMFAYLTERLAMAGYERYEISNYCLPGFHSRHNSTYWTGNPYLGLGPSAHSYDGARIRRWNPADLKGYLRRFSEDMEEREERDERDEREERDERHHLKEDKGSTGVFYEEEILNDEELREEYILTRMRMAGGIDINDYTLRFGEEAAKKLLQNASKELWEGKLKKEGERIFLSEKGVMVADTVILELAM